MATKKTRRAKPKTQARKTNPHPSRTSAKRAAARRPRRRRNPSLNPGSLIENLAFAGLGAVATDVLYTFVPQVGGGQLVQLGIKGAVAYGTGVVAKKFFGVSDKHAEMIAIGGGVAVAKDAINGFVLPTIQGVIGPRPVAVAPSAAPKTLKGLGDMVTVRRGAYDPYYGSTPGFGDIVTRRPINY